MFNFKNLVLIVIIIIAITVVIKQTHKQKKHMESKSKYIDNPKYSVQEIDNLLSSEECDKIIKLSDSRLVDSTVYSSDKDNVNDKHRTSKQCWLKQKDSPVVKKICEITEKITGKPICNQEDLQVVRYSPNGFFNAHYDACDGSPEFCKRMDGSAGPRLATLLIYLNDNYEGGETYFPLINYKTTPKKGKAVLFYNIDPSSECLIKQSMHAGNPVKCGQKWICNKWVRMRKYSR